MPPWSYDISVLDERLKALEKRTTELATILNKLLNILLKEGEQNCLNQQNY